MFEIEIINEGKHVGFLDGYNYVEINTVASILEDAGYEIDWGDNE